MPQFWTQVTCITHTLVRVCFILFVIIMFIQKIQTPQSASIHPFSHFFQLANNVVWDGGWMDTLKINMEKYKKAPSKNLFSSSDFIELHVKLPSSVYLHYYMLKGSKADNTLVFFGGRKEFHNHPSEIMK